IQTSEDIQYTEIPDTKSHFINFNKVHALLKKNMIRLTRSRILFFGFLLLPTIEFMTFAICIGPPPNHLKVAVYNPEDPPEYSKDFLSYINQDIIIQVNYSSHAAARQA